MFYLKNFRNYIFNFDAFLRNKVIMTYLKLIFLVLVAITIFACESDTVKPIDPIDIVWEPAGSLPSMATVWGMTFVNNGNIWLTSYNDSEYKLSFYLSTNNGATWDEKYNVFERDSIYEILGTHVNPVNGDMFRLSTTFYGQFSYHRELMKSTNNGNSWETIIIMDTTNIRDLAMRGSIFTASGEIYLGILKIYGIGTTWENTCYYSNDNGNTWVEKSKGLPDLWLTAVGKDGTLYARSSNGVYRSTDKGITWLPSSNYNNWVASLTICDDGSIFGTVLNVGIVKSTDKGVNWTKLNTGSLATAINGKIIYNSVTKDLFVVDDAGSIHKSDNLGKDWKLVENEELPISNRLREINVNPKTGQMFVVTNTGVYRTKNYPK